MNNYQKKYHTKTFALFWKLYIMRRIFWAKFMEALCRRTTIIARAPSLWLRGRA
ncbi:hypothetical protein STM14_4023 [Salmonella enterica subsp. enterica serovar Typhimurium str. 14028S]|uniref:Uncharacterized protein n=2 Tax=Salmonella enterica I TaxID=59201 RepID=A0A0F6B7C2_SALT1|nr:hypothetical protein SPAB_04156 [Salmonella enterica subsp. enterica serovar Paratyphi B str. SPB7]ACY90419.1 hypothetical protein STM14_4023 [Salmonella enterica subsp. enterica serovar Typhimurium str. 14028S]